ncbi:MAG: YggS family pyridoxal phosphate-dependent enzyme [Flavobacteriaceae bacterium]|nr:YggS family pyridoxal phosphate-dependent enzyme [Flavobacteriaceae bacterium]
MSISENLKFFKNDLPETVSLVAVSKTKPLEDLEEAYKFGQRIFGENKIQEMTDKWQHLPKEIEWHMIGHVQTNKVKYMAPYVSLVHGVDRIKVWSEIHKQGLKNDRVIHCLLQVHIAEEETKFGFSTEEIKEIIARKTLLEFPNAKVVGLMGMASNSDDKDKVRAEFKGLRKLFDLANELGCDFKVLSMGMSGDYNIAIEEGSNMVRVGSKIFGHRNY